MPNFFKKRKSCVVSELLACKSPGASSLEMLPVTDVLHEYRIQEWSAYGTLQRTVELFLWPAYGAGYGTVVRP
jgi:hypothetical protein